MQTPREYFERVVQKNYYDFFDNVTDMRAFFGFCVSAFHLHEWVFHFHKATPEKIFSAQNEYEYAELLYKECPDFKVIRNLATYYKHRQPTSRGGYKFDHHARWAAGDTAGLPLGDFLRILSDGENAKSKFMRVHRMCEKLLGRYDL